MIREAANTLASRLNRTRGLRRFYAIVHSDNQVTLKGGRNMVTEEHKRLMLTEAAKIGEEHRLTVTHHAHANGAFSVLFNASTEKRGRA